MAGLDDLVEMPIILKENWNHDACVNSPVSGDVWEDVLRKVAVWSFRCDIYAARLERVCKRWMHFWQVAEGVFDIDLRAGRLKNVKLVFRTEPYTLFTMLDVKRHRERERLNYITAQYQIVEVNRPPPPPERTPEEIMAEHKRKTEEMMAQLQRGQQERLTAMRVTMGLPSPREPPTANVSQFLASWPSGNVGDAQ